MSSLTKDQRMCLRKYLHCDKSFICRLAYQAARMELRLEYKKKDLGSCPAFAQMVKDGTL